MKAEELAVIKERAEKATPGEWKTDEHRVYSEKVDDDFICEMWLSFEDAEFIAHAREDIPKLVAEVESLLQQREDLLEVNERIQTQIVDAFMEVERLRSIIWRISAYCDMSIEETQAFLDGDDYE